MSNTYINEHKNISAEYIDCPILLKDFIKYMTIRRNLSAKTINGYYVDIRFYIRFLLVSAGLVNSESEKFDDVSIRTCPERIILSATSREIEDFLYFCATEQKNKPQTQARKLCAIKAFYDYLCNQAHKIEIDPAAKVLAPSLRGSREPIFMTYDQCIKLLDSIDTECTSRDHCIITMFLNCGMRISELVGIDIDKIFFDEGTIKILGKGNKERMAYLTPALKLSLSRYLEDRSLYQGVIDTKALFISPRTGRRLTVRGVEVMVEKALKKAGFSGMRLSPHKFRHTAATLMYSGGANVLELKEVLGHESIATTTIYTHLTGSLSNVVSRNPLSNIDV